MPSKTTDGSDVPLVQPDLPVRRAIPERQLNNNRGRLDRGARTGARGRGTGLREPLVRVRVAGAPRCRAIPATARVSLAAWPRLAYFDSGLI